MFGVALDPEFISGLMLKSEIENFWCVGEG
jgi:hypothetical protein